MLALDIIGQTKKRKKKKRNKKEREKKKEKKKRRGYFLLRVRFPPLLSQDSEGLANTGNLVINLTDTDTHPPYFISLGCRRLTPCVLGSYIGYVTDSYEVTVTVRPFCFTSTEARWLIRDWDRGGRGRKNEGSTADTARKRPERPWTAATTMEVLRRCPLAIAQRLVHRAIAVSTAVLGQSHKDNVRCTAVEQQLEAKEVQLSQPSSTSLLMVSSGLT